MIVRPAILDRLVVPVVSGHYPATDMNWRYRRCTSALSFENPLENTLSTATTRLCPSVSDILPTYSWTWMPRHVRSGWTDWLPCHSSAVSSKKVYVHTPYLQGSE